MYDLIINTLSCLAIAGYLGIGVYLFRSRQLIGGSLSMISLGSFFWGSGILLFRTIPFNVTMLLILNALFIISSSVVANSFLHFSLTFNSNTFWRKSYYSFLLYIPSILVAIFVFYPGVLISKIIETPWGRESIIGTYYSYFGIYIVCTFIFGSIVLLRAYFNAEKNIKIQLISVLVATSITGLIDIYYNLILVLFGNYRYIWVGPLSSFFWVTCLFMAITKFDLLKNPLVVTKAISQFIAFVLMSVSFLCIQLLSLSYGLKLIVSFMFTVFWGVFFHKIKTFFLTTLKKKFLKGTYDAEEIISNLSSVLIYQQDFDSVMKTIATEFVNQLELSGSCILIKNKEKTYFDLKNIEEGTVMHSLSIEHPFIEYCQNKATPFLLKELPEITKQSIQNLNLDSESVGFAIHSFKEVQGIFILNQKLTEDKFTQNDFKLLSTVTNQVIVVFERISREQELYEVNVKLKQLNETLENTVSEQVKEIKEKQKMDEELRIASQIQERVLPSKVPALSNYQIATYFYPARTVSGDYYDFLVFSKNKIGIVIADIVGKGIPAAFHMMNLKTLIHQTILPQYSPAEALSRLHQEIIKDRVIEKYVPMIYAILDTQKNTFTYSNAGHEPGYYYNEGNAQCLEVGGAPLGMDSSQEKFLEETISIQDESLFLLFTDGLTDLRNIDNESFGLDRIQTIVSSYKKNTHTEHSLHNQLISMWKTFQGSNRIQKDDMTLITIEHQKLDIMPLNKKRKRPKR